MRHRNRTLLLLSALVLAFVATAHAQDYRAKVQGVVTDSSQAVVVGAKVTLANVNTGVSATKQSGANGAYIFDFVEPGAYTLTVEQTGFNKFVQENIVVQVRGDVTVNAVLTVGGVSQEVTVSELAIGVQFNTSTMEITVDRKMLTELPILARNPFSLALLNPAVVNRYWADRNPFFMWSSSAIDVGGSTDGHNDLLLDGAPLMMSIKGSYAPSMDAVQEFTVQQNSVDAEFGNSAGGTLSLSMRSGGNEFHGTAYYFGRNPVFNAASNAVTHTPNVVRNHIWGGTLGNPIVKNKLFTYTAWEQWRKREPRTNFMTMATDLERTGDFSKSLNAEGGLRTIYDPWTTRLDNNSNQYIRTPFAENVIPSDHLDAAALKFMQDVWKPNNPGDDITGVNNFKETWAFSLKYWNFSNRTDWNINDKWRVFGRYSQFHNTIEELHTVKTRALTGWDGGAMYALNVAGESVYVFSPSTVFSAGGSYGSIHDDYFAPNVEIKENDLASFWPSGWYQPYIKDLPQIYYPALNIGNASLGHGFYWIEHPKNASLRGKLSYIVGKHDIRLGLQYRRHFGLIQYPDLMDFNFGPELTADTFVQPNTLLSGHPWATFLIGALDENSLAQYISPHELTVHTFAPFFQDDIKVNSKLTLNLGLRYEYETAPKDRKDRLSRYLDLTNPIPEMQASPPVLPPEVTALRTSAPVYNGAWVFTDSNNRSLFKTTKLGFAPRVGMAYRISDKTALRVGYARFITPVPMTQAFESDLRLYGFTARTATAPSIEGIPGSRLSDPFNSSYPLILPLGKSLGRYQNLGDSAAWDVQDFKTSPNDRFSFTIQRQLPANFVLDATYFINLGSNLPYDKPYNMVDPNLRYTYKDELDRGVANPFYNYLTPDKFPGPLRNISTVSVGDLLSPYPQYTGLTQVLTPRREERYHALQLRVQRQFTKGLGLLWTYSYNRERATQFFNDLDLYADRTTFIDSNSPRHRMNIAGTYDLPVGKGRQYLSNSQPVVNAILGGWSFSWIFMYNSGEFLRFGQAIVDGNPAIDSPTRARYFDTSKFNPPEPYTPRMNPWQYPGVTGPRFANMDVTLAKYFPITERYRLELRMEAYNLTNSFMAGNPSTDVYSSLFGRSTSQANRGREMQYTLRVHF